MSINQDEREESLVFIYFLALFRDNELERAEVGDSWLEKRLQDFFKLSKDGLIFPIPRLWPKHFNIRKAIKFKKL